MESIRFHRLSPWIARTVFWVWCAMAVVGAVLFWDSGKFAERDIGSGIVAPTDAGKNDMAFYRQIVAGVHDGGNYYDVAREILPTYYPRYGSVFNWRLP